MYLPMIPHERINSWLTCDDADPNSFINFVNYGDLNDYQENIIGKKELVNERDIAKAIKKIHDYIKSSLVFLNSSDAEIIKQLADRVIKVSKDVRHLNPHGIDLHSLAGRLEKLKHSRFTVDVKENAYLLSSEFGELIGMNFSFREVVEIIAVGQPISENIIKHVFKNPDSAGLATFVEQICQVLIKARASARLRRVGHSTEPEGVSLAKQDAQIGYLRTFCNLASGSEKALDWSTSARQAINTYADKQDDWARTSCLSVVTDILKNYLRVHVEKLNKLSVTGSAIAGKPRLPSNALVE